MHRLYKYTPFLIGGLLLYTGVYKLICPAQAVLALIALGVGDSLAQAAVTATTILELYLGAILICRLDIRFGLGATTALVFVFSVFLAFLTTLARPPACGCMGITSVFASNRHNALLGLARNCALLWLLKGAFEYYSSPTPNVVNGPSGGGRDSVKSA